MRRRRKGVATVVAALMLAAPAGFALAEVQPIEEPILRIETGVHSAPVNSIGVDTACRLLVTGSQDKTARLWALPESGAGEPKLLRVLRVPIGPGNDGKIFGVTLSPDGRYAAAAGWDALGAQTHDNGVYVFDTANGKLVQRLGKVGNVILHLAFSLDGNYLAASLGSGQGLRVWDTANWRMVGEDSNYGVGGSYSVAFDAAGKVYTVANDGFLRRYGKDFKPDAIPVKLFGGKYPYGLAINPKDNRIAIVFDDTPNVEVYDAATLQHLYTAEAADRSNRNFYGVSWSSDGARLYAGGRINGQREGHPVVYWGQEGRDKPREADVSSNTIMQLLPCRDEIAVATQDPSFGLVSSSGEKVAWQVSSSPDMREKRYGNFTVSEDGSKVHFTLDNGSKIPVLFDLATGRLTDQPQPVAGLFPPETKSLKIENWINDEQPKLNGKPIVLEPYEIARSLAITPDGNAFVLGTDWWIRAYDRTGRELWKHEVPGVVWGVNITRDDRYLIAAYGDGTIRWHRLTDGVEVLALFVNTKTREWVLWTPQGYYASSVAGDQNIGWHLNRGWNQASEFVTAARLKKHLYRPDIIKHAYEFGDSDKAIREAGLSGFKLADLIQHAPPAFNIVDPGENSRVDKSPITVKLDFAANEDPLTGFDVKVNGRQVTPRAVRDLPPLTQAQLRTLNIPLEKGDNHIQVTAHNSVGDSVHELVVHLDREGVLNRKGTLFVIAIGVDKYPKLGAENSLHYAAADARMMLDTLTKKAGPLHTDVKSKLLVTGGDTPPTKANIEDALLLFHDAGPQDTVILFLAGHGVNEGADYLFMPEDAQDFDGKHYRPSTVVKWSVLQQALQDAQGSRIMFVDTCHARGAFSSRLIKDAADANIVVFSATDNATEAQEREDLGHGVFTYALDEGLRGGADIWKRGTVNILELSAYVSAEVRRLTNDEQDPTFNISGAKNFVLATP
jgi:WD40 repeat protein